MAAFLNTSQCELSLSLSNSVVSITAVVSHLFGFCSMRVFQFVHPMVLSLRACVCLCMCVCVCVRSIVCGFHDQVF